MYFKIIAFKQKDTIEVVKNSSEITPYLSQFCDCYQEVFGGAPYFETFESQTLETEFSELLDQKPGSCILLARDDVGVSGFGVGYIQPEDNAFYIAELGVSARKRGQRLGKRLFQSLLEYGRKQQPTKFRLRTLNDEGQNKVALHLYRSCGFLETGDTETISSQRKDGSTSTDQRVVMEAAVSS